MRAGIRAVASAPSLYLLQYSALPTLLMLLTLDLQLEEQSAQVSSWAVWSQPNRPPLHVNLGRQRSCFRYICVVTSRRPPTDTLDTTSRTSAACSRYVSSIRAAKGQSVAQILAAIIIGQPSYSRKPSGLLCAILLPAVHSRA